MTFNATGLSLPWDPKDKGLVLREPLRPLLPEQKRWLLVTHDIDDLLDGRKAFGAFPAHEAEALVGKYCAGYLMMVSRQRTKKKPDLEQLEGFDEIWAICPRKPAPGWRLLGRFYRHNVFVALRAWDKHRLASQYPTAAAEVIADWQALFGADDPHRGKEISDYIRYRDVDQAV